MKFSCPFCYMSGFQLKTENAEDTLPCLDK